MNEVIEKKSRMQVNQSSSGLDKAIKALLQRESSPASMSHVPTIPPPELNSFPSHVFKPNPATSISASSVLGLSASEISSSPVKDVVFDTRSDATPGQQLPHFAAAQSPIVNSQSSFAASRPLPFFRPRNVEEDAIDLDLQKPAVFPSFSQFVPNDLNGSTRKHGDDKTLKVHFVVGCVPFHTMLPEARLKLFQFIKKTLYSHCTDADRVTVSFWCPCRSRSPRGASLALPNVPNFGRHSSRHSFVDDVFSCALEMHSLNLFHPDDFQYHLYHSYLDVAASLGDVRDSLESKSEQLWNMNPLMQSVFLHKSVFADVSDFAEHYCATAMQPQDDNTQHAVICLGGDLSSLFAIKAAIEQGFHVFIMSQTGKLSDCISRAWQMQQDKSTHHSEILAGVTSMLKHSTSLGEGAADSEHIWLHLDGRHPDVFFPGICEAILFITRCPLVHFLDVGDASISSQFSRILEDFKAFEEYSGPPFPSLFKSLFALGTHHVAELLKRMKSRKAQEKQSGAELAPFRVFRAKGNGSILVIELPKQLLTAPRIVKQVSWHLNQVVRDAFSLSNQSNKGTHTHRYTCLDPMVYVRLHYCGHEIADNLLQASQFVPVWFSQQQDTGVPGLEPGVQPCEGLIGDSLYPSHHSTFRSAVGNVQTANYMFGAARRRSMTRGKDGADVLAAVASAMELSPVSRTRNNFPYVRNLSVKIVFQSAESDNVPNEATSVSKFRRAFEVSNDFPNISLVGSASACTYYDLFVWDASITTDSRNYIIIDVNSNLNTYKPIMVPDCLIPLSTFDGAPCTAIEFMFGVQKNDSERAVPGQVSASVPSLDFKQMLEIYHGLFQEFLGSLYRDTVLIFNLCNKVPPNEQKMSYKSLCSCLYTILKDPFKVKDIENALSSSSFQSLQPGLSESKNESNAGFVWSRKDQNIFWKGVFAASVFSDLNEILISRCESREGLLNMRWNDSLVRVVEHYENIGDNNIWANIGYAILFAHEKNQQHRDDHDLHRMLINIVTSRRVIKSECRLVRAPKAQTGVPSPVKLSLPETCSSVLSRSSSECTLNQAIARCIIKCEGNITEQGQKFIMNAYDCFGETTLMHAAVINDLQLAREVLTVADFDYIVAESRHPHALHQSALYMALIRGNLEMAEVILNSIIMRLDEMRSRTGTEESKSTKNSSLINVALSVTVGGYYAHTKESIQDIRWSMQGYRKLLVAEIESEYVMLNMLQRLVKFSSETVDGFLRAPIKRSEKSWSKREVVLFRHILEKSFESSSEPPAHEIHDVVHLCCCLSCPLHSKKNNKHPTNESCILRFAQQWPEASKTIMSRNRDGKQEPIIMHWYDLVEHLSNKGIRNTAVFLHGLGDDLTNKFTENSENKEESILNHLKNQKVIRIVFDGHELWDFECSSDEHLCISFQQAVENYHRVVNMEKPKLTSIFGFCPVSRFRLTCLMLACRWPSSVVSFVTLFDCICSEDDKFGATNLLQKMRQIFSSCFEMYASEFFDEQPLFENLLNLEDSNGQNVLYHAIRSGDKECVRLLLSHNISPVSTFDSKKVERTPCICGASKCSDSQLPNSSSNKQSNFFCVCQPSQRLFAFLIMSLDLIQIMKTSSVKTDGLLASSLQLPRLETMDAFLNNFESQGSYRILDTDVYSFSTEDSKKMWRRCIENIATFTPPQMSSVQLGDRTHIHMSLKPLQSTDAKFGSLHMESSFVSAQKFWWDESKDESKPLNISNDPAMLIRRLMFCCFCFFSGKMRTDDWYQARIEEMNRCVDVALDACLAGQKPSVLVQNEQLDSFSSLLFMLANALFNCSVSLKMSLCTKHAKSPYSWSATSIRLIDASFRIFKTLEHVSHKAVLVLNNQSTEPSGIEKWHDAFRLGSYESLIYFNHLQKILGISTNSNSSQRSFLGPMAGMRTACSRHSSAHQSPQPHLSVSIDTGLPFLMGRSRELPSFERGPSSSGLKHNLNESIDPPMRFSLDDEQEYLSFTIEHDKYNSILHSPAFRTSFAARKRKLGLLTNATVDQLKELAILYIVQSNLDNQDRVAGKSQPVPLSGSADFSISNSSSIALFPRMDRSLVLGFSRAVDSAQLNGSDGRRSLLIVAGGNQNENELVGSNADLMKELGNFVDLPDNKVPPFFDSLTNKTYRNMTNISVTASKIQNMQPSPESGRPKRTKHPVLIQRLAEALPTWPLHGMIPNDFLNCYEVSLLSVNVHSQVSAQITDKSLSQTVLSDPNTMTINTTEETVKQQKFCESMLSIMHDHPKSAASVNAFRHNFASKRSTRIVLNHACVFILIIALALSAASGPEVSGFVQYIRKSVSVISIPSLTPMSVFQSNVNMLAPLLWPHCNTNPSSCGLSRLGSVRVTQWRKSSLADTPCFSSSQFSSSCLASDSNSVSIPGTASEATLVFKSRNLSVGSNGQIIVHLDSGSMDEALWTEIFKADSLFFTAETSKIEIVSTLFSPKLQHFVSFEITALFDAGLSQFSYHMYDFSSFEFSRAKTALCIAILCAAVVASLSDLFRIQTIFAPAQHVKSAFYLKWSGRSTAVKKSDVDWEIRPLTGKQVSLTVLTVPLLAMGLIVSNEMGAVRKFSAINSAAAADRQFFDAFSSNIQDPASVQMVFLTFLLFCSVWELVICMTTGPALGPILRGIIQLLRDSHVLSFVGLLIIIITTFSFVLYTTYSAYLPQLSSFSRAWTMNLLFTFGGGDWTGINLMFNNAPPIGSDISFVYFLCTLQMIVVNLITLNIIIAVLNTRYGKLTQTFSREKYEQWLTQCLSDHVFKRNMIRGGRCRAFLLHVLQFGHPTNVEKLQLRFMIAAEQVISGNIRYWRRLCLWAEHWFSFFFFEETIFSTSVWRRFNGEDKPLSVQISNLVNDEYLRLYNSPSSRMLFPDKAVQVHVEKASEKETHFDFSAKAFESVLKKMDEMQRSIAELTELRLSVPPTPLSRVANNSTPLGRTSSAH